MDNKEFNSEQIKASITQSDSSFSSEAIRASIQSQNVITSAQQNNPRLLCDSERRSMCEELEPRYKNFSKDDNNDD